MTVSADDYMSREIGSLVFWCARLVKRVEAYGRLPLETREGATAQALMAKDEQMRKAYLVALRLRAAEVEAYALRHGVRVPQALVKDNPFLVCTALMHHMGCLDDKENNDGRATQG